MFGHRETGNRLADFTDSSEFVARKFVVARMVQWLLFIGAAFLHFLVKCRPPAALLIASKSRELFERHSTGNPHRADFAGLIRALAVPAQCHSSAARLKSCYCHLATWPKNAKTLYLKSEHLNRIFFNLSSFLVLTSRPKNLGQQRISAMHRMTKK